MSEQQDLIEAVDREILRLNDEIEALRTNGRKDGDETLRELQDQREELKGRKAELESSGGVEGKAPRDPVSGQPLGDETFDEAVRNGLRRFH